MIWSRDQQGLGVWGCPGKEDPREGEALGRCKSSSVAGRALGFGPEACTPQFSLMIAYFEFKKAILHPVVMDGIVMEVSLFSFFIVVYTVALNRYITCVMWSISVSEGG